MDRLRAQEHVVIVATDVAARGIDVENVDYVVHYNVPFSAESYVHRSGRTARASASGTSLALISAEEQSQFRKICSTLAKPAGGLPEMPVSAPTHAVLLMAAQVISARLKALRARLRLAKQLDKVLYKIWK